MGIGQILVDFSGWTSAHGIPHIGAAKNWCLRMFWTIIFLACLGMFCYQMALLVEKFLSYGVNVNTELLFEKRAFPAITVCNLNPYKGTLVTTTTLVPFMKTLMSDYTQVLNNAAPTQTYWGFNTSNSGDSLTMQSTGRESLIYVARFYESMNTLKNVTYSYSDFIMRCQYNNQPCYESDFTTILDPIYGMCYTFNKASDKTLWKNSTRAGPLYGLRLLLNVKQSEYLALTETAGVRVAVHNQQESPFPDAFGYNAAAGFTTAFGIKFVKTERLPAPNGNCTESTDGGSTYYYDGDYTVEGCFRSCFEAAVYEKCGCGDPKYELATGQSYCLYNDTSKRECVSSFSLSNSTFSASKDCKCPQPCYEQTYSVTVSTALWPSTKYTPTDCVTAPGASLLQSPCRSWYSDNTAAIEVYYERMNYQHLAESEDYTFTNLISDFGGQIGLWLGISAISVIEFLSLIVVVIAYCATRKKTQQQQQGQQNAYEMGGQKPGGEFQKQMPSDINNEPPPPYDEAVSAKPTSGRASRGTARLRSGRPTSGPNDIDPYAAGDGMNDAPPPAV